MENKNLVATVEIKILDKYSYYLDGILTQENDFSGIIEKKLELDGYITLE